MAVRMKPGYEMQDRSLPSHLSPFEQEKVVYYLKLVKWIVGRVSERFTGLPGHIEKGDLMQSGILGLIDAVKRFPWGREREEEEFKAYAECRIRGQVMDDLRQCDVLPRSARDKVKRFKAVQDLLRQRLKREPDESEMCAELQVDLETYHHLRGETNYGRQFSIDALQSASDTIESVIRKTLDMVDPHSPEAMFHVEEVKKVLAEEIDSLDDRERTVISLYYYDELTLKEIGQVLSVTESRVSQIHSQALSKLTKRIKGTFGSDSPMVDGL